MYRNAGIAEWQKVGKQGKDDGKKQFLITGHLGILLSHSAALL